MTTPAAGPKEVTVLGKMLRKLRVQLEITQAQMAEKINMKPTLLSRIEVGRQTPPVNFLGALRFSYSEIREDDYAYETAFNLAREKVLISLKNENYEDAELVTLISKRFSSLSAIAKEELRNILTSNHPS